jgi:2,4-dienoyl-CoA reductase-like NADH-dependent reductase (Old Yellow Enzyme family)
MKKVSAIEISYSTMDYALNIMQGELPVNLVLKINPRFKTGNNKLKNFFYKYFLIPLIKLRIKKFSPMYNLDFAKIAKKYTNIPIITVGGIRTANQIKNIIEKDNIDFVSLSRPFICEYDFVKKIKIDPDYISKCSNCNYCTIMCDSCKPTRCYKNN